MKSICWVETGTYLMTYVYETFLPLFFLEYCDIYSDIGDNMTRGGVSSLATKTYSIIGLKIFVHVTFDSRAIVGYLRKRKQYLEVI